jgi:hypothetical protein
MAAPIYRLPDAVDLFDRSYRLQIEDLLITELHITLSVKRSLSAKVANSAEVTVYNLSTDNRKRLQALQNVFVSLEAGYSGVNSLLFRGDLREAWSHRDGTDWITEVSSASAVVNRKQKRVQASFPAGTSVRQIIEHCAGALQIGLGNTQKQAANAKLWNVSPPAFTTGYVASGDAVSQLDRVCRSCGLEWSIQDSQLQLLPRGEALQEDGIILTPDSGLLDSPELGKGGVVRCKTLMIPGLYPGRRVELRTRHVQGVYRIETTHHQGGFDDGDEWGAELELTVLNGKTT